MELRINLTQKMDQRLVMTPKLVQAIKILQKTTLELRQMVQQEVLQNPVLEEVEDIQEDRQEDPLSEEAPDREEPEPSDDSEDIDWRELFQNDYDEMSFGRERIPQDEFYERDPSNPKTLSDHLTEQLRLSTSSEEDIAIGEYLIGNLNDEGYLTMSPEEIAEELSVDLKKVNLVLELLQTFDPPGVGARELVECLLIQLAQSGEDQTLAALIVREHFEDFKQRRFAEIARKTHTSIKEVQKAADLIAGLDPKPGLRISDEGVRYIVPELVVEKVEGEYKVFLNDSNVPRLRINSAYRDMVTSKDGKGEGHAYIVNKLNSARWFIQAIEQRRRTMRKVMEAIVEIQRDFFDKGPESIRPLTLQQVAERVQMHESTVSRVTSNKYVQTPRGVFNLKYFFSSSLRTEDGDRVSTKTAKARIKELVEKEDRKKPLSDREIVELLRKEGLIVARRTVAKYREQLDIPPARLRREY